MKLAQLLAKELKEWPKGVGKVMQDFDMEIRFFDLSGDQMTLLDFYIDELASDACDEIRFAGGGVEITKSQWQAERKKMNKPKWIRHRGGKCPVPCGTKVETRHRNGYICTPHFYTQNSSSDVGMNLVWSHKGDKMDIMAYRVIEETKDQEIEEVKVADVKLEMLQGDSLVTIGSVSSDFGASVFDGGQPAKGEEVKKTNFGTITYKLEIDATDANKEIDSLVAKWGQIESPLKWRDEIIELEAYEEEFRREREKLIRKLESEGFNLIDHAPAKCLLDEWEAMDYESFCVGDTVVCIHEKPDDTIAELTIGKEYRLILDDEQICVIDDIGDPMRYCIEIGCFKMVKRA